MSDEFYIGYRKTVPPATGRFVVRVAIAFVFLTVVAAFTIGGLQNRPGNGEYAFGAVETFEGVLVAEPVPHVELSNGRLSVLVARGKHGLPPYAREALGHHVRFKATRIEREGQLMLELAGPERFEVLEPAKPMLPIATTPDASTLIGELVDSKCYLGVMNPGRGKVHRGCAAECLRGGVQPALLVREDNGPGRVLLIDANPNTINPEWAGRTLAISGTVQQTGELVTLFADTIRLMP